MKKLLLLTAIFVSNLALAQTQTKNYVKSTSFQEPVQNQVDIDALSQHDKIESITYFDGLGRAEQNIDIRSGGDLLNNNLIDWKNNWNQGNTGSAPFFNQNGSTIENRIITGPTPYGDTDVIWECSNQDADTAGESSRFDGGWNTNYMVIDHTVGYRYSIWVKRTGSHDGTTYHGTQNVNNLSGNPVGNPYFWTGDLPNINQWYLLIGVIHPSNYAGRPSGISGVYDISGVKVKSGTDYKWSRKTRTSRFRSYLYYTSDLNTKQYFFDPIVQRLDGNQASITDLIEGHKGKDIITHIDYDAYGRQTKEFLPYSASTDGGLYKEMAKLETLNYYDATRYEADFSGMTPATINPYSEKHLETSPLNRVLEQGAPGKDWLVNKDSDADHTIKFNYQTNTATEVRNYHVSLQESTVGVTTTYIPTLVLNTSINNGYYNVNTLYKSVTKDENWVSGTNHTTEEFKNKQGQVVLKRTYNANEKHDTYYIYDNYGNLTYVLPPKAEAHIAKPDAAKLAMLCYQYKYDNRNRLVEKKIPGKGTASNWEQIIYNKLDQPILTRDPNLKAQNRWLFTKYDAFGRVAYTGIMNSKSSRVSLQNEANAIATLFVSKLNSAISLAGTALYYNNSGYPITNIVEIHTINYYDNYTFDRVGGNAEIAYGIDPITNAKGLATGSKVRVLESFPVKWITSVIYYDQKARPIYNYNHNDYLQTTDKIKSKLNFIGKVLEVTTEHIRTGQPILTIVDSFSYDTMGRLLTQKQKINNLAEELITKNNYDALGQLVSKNVGGKTTQGRLQNVDYTYNVRGWLKTINDPSKLGNDLFSFRLNYNITNHGATSLFNGNISETEWRTANTDNNLKWYKYSYDALNRITSGTDNTNNYNLGNLSYDKNGNILTLKRIGQLNSQATAFGNLDELNYFYDGNQLLKVNDLSANTFGFNDGNTSGNDYEYDINGNMIIDSNKGITDITYNHLNLPKRIIFNNNGPRSSNPEFIDYIYDATGVKQEKKVKQLNISNVFRTFYSGNFIYKHEGRLGVKLKYFNHTEGYIEPTFISGKKGLFLSDVNYVYQFKDHLGNLRLSYSDSDNDGSINASTEIISEKNYYPFGLQHKGYNNVVTSTNPAQNYTYNGKEEQNELGLNWHDYGARNYQADLGRWMNVDNHADSYFDYSPYNYAINNPINVIDPDGNDIYILIWATDRANGKYGHAGIAVDNYKTQNKKDANGNDVLDANGNVVTEQVKDGTFTYYDLWPGVDNDGDGVGDDFGSAGPNLKDSFIGMPAYYQNNSVHSLSDLINGDPSGAEGYAPDGAIRLNAGYEETMETVDDLTSYMKSNKNYKSALNNCSNFCLQGTLEPLDKMGVFTSRGAFESYLGGYTNIVTPNQLYKYLQEKVNSNPTEGRVVKSAGTKVDEKFTSNKEIKGN